MLIFSCNNKKESKIKHKLTGADIRFGGIKGKRIFINRLGDTLYNGEQFYDTKGFKNNYCIVSKLVNGQLKYGVINVIGEKIIPITLEEEIVFEKKKYFYIKKNNSNYGWIDITGKTVVPPIYLQSRLHVNEKIVVVQNNKFKWGIIDFDEKKILPIKYDWIGKWHDDLAVIKLDKKWGYINKKCEIIIKLNFSFAKKFEHGVALCKMKNKYGIIDTNGKSITGFVYDDYKEIIDVYNNEYDDKWNQNKRFLMEEGYIIVEKNGKWGYINKEGETIIPFEFDFIGLAQRGQYKVPITKSGKKGLYNIKERKIEWNKN
jgi:hypothetical protein